MNVLKSESSSARVGDFGDLPMQMIDVGGRRLAFTSSGQVPRPWYSKRGWARKQRVGCRSTRRQEFARVCRYDRAGRRMSIAQRRYVPRSTWSTIFAACSHR
jgi:hypothetical protein